MMTESSMKNLDDLNRQKVMEAILDNTASCIYVKDLELRYILVNRFALKCFGFKEGEVLGKTDEELFPIAYAAASTASDLKVIRTRCTVKEEHLASLSTGEHYFHTVKTPLLDSEGNPFAICGIATDISEEKYAQSELQNYLEKLEGITTELMEARIVSEQANKMKNAFLANMSHELRTPLNGIIGTVSILKQEERSPIEEKYLERILAASQILMDIINQILDFSKIAAGELKLESIPCDLKEILEECYKILVTKAEQKGLDFSLSLPKEQIPKVLGDPTRLKQIFINLAGNSLKFTEKGHVNLSLATLPLQNNKIEATFTVEDTGIGIEQDKLSHLFEKFWQADVSNTRKYGGTGLGLAIVKEVIDLMHGGISVRSEVGKGTIFTIKLPFPLAAEQ